LTIELIQVSHVQIAHHVHRIGPNEYYIDNAPYLRIFRILNKSPINKKHINLKIYLPPYPALMIEHQIRRTKIIPF